MTLGSNFGSGQNFKPDSPEEKVSHEELDAILAHKANRSTIENHENRLKKIEADIATIKGILNLL